jgi:formylglycine-generating enzyme required for sulfatase activity
MTRIFTALLLLVFLQPAMAQRKYNRTSQDSLQIYTIRVEGGSFDMGSDDEEADRKPAHTVTLKDFWMSAYEVTQLQWCEIMRDQPSGSIVCPDCPANNVNWFEIQEFIKKLNANTGRHFRLPTEAEWEYAARGGVKEQLVKARRQRGACVGEFTENDKGTRRPDKILEGKKYSGRRAGARSIAWYADNSHDQIHPVGRKQPNDLGIFDMNGNVEEWGYDFYANSYGSKQPVDNPKGPATGKSHVVRGGSFSSTANELIVTRRAAYLPETKAVNLGFRLVEDK